jgi:hypothetical protein
VTTCAHYMRNYHRLKRLGGGDYDRGKAIERAERRSEMSPYDLGTEDATVHAVAVDMHNARPPKACPFPKGTAEEAEHDRGWSARLAGAYRQTKGVKPPGPSSPTP